MGKVAYSSKTCNPCTGEHYARYLSSTEPHSCTSTSWAKIWDGHWRCNGIYGKRSTNQEQSTETSMGAKMPKNNGGRRFVWRTSMASMWPKRISLLYLSIGTEGWRLLTQKFPHDNIHDLTTLKLWEMMEIAFIRPRNITFDRYVFFLRKQKKGETVEQFYSILKEMADNWDFENREEVIIRDIFITKMLDDNIQREPLRDTVDPERALSIAVNLEMGHQNQQRISSNNVNSASGSTINAIQSVNRFRGANARGNQQAE